MNDAVTNGKLRDSAGFSVIGQTASASGNPADIVAGNETVLGRTGGGDLVFAQIDTGQIADNAVSFAKIESVSSDRLLGRDTAGLGNVEQILVTSGLEFTGGGAVRIADNGVTNAKLRDSIATSVIGRSANSTGDPADIQAGAVGQVLRQGAGPVLGFGAVDLADTDAVTGVLPAGNWTVLTTEGDLVFRNGSITTRLPRGSDGQCLTATATTIAWGACSAGGGLTHPQVMTRVSLGY